MLLRVTPQRRAVVDGILTFESVLLLNPPSSSLLSILLPSQEQKAKERADALMKLSNGDVEAVPLVSGTKDDHMGGRGSPSRRN